MTRYKTQVCDYEALQEILDAHAIQGWRLFSIHPDTWRKSVAPGDGEDRPPFEQLAVPGDQTQEYSASYYLLVFQRDDHTVDDLLAATMEEPIGASISEEDL